MPVSFAIRDVDEDVFERLPSQFREDRPRIRAYALAVGEVLQAAHDEIASLILDRTLDNAVDAPLEQYGRLVNEVRGGLSDDDYRRVIKARIAANQATGEVGDLRELFATLFAVAPEAVVIRQIPPLSVLFTITVTTYASDALVPRILRIVEIARPAGVRFMISEIIAPSFVLSGDAGEGLGDGLLGRSLL